jgi:hypothetical protein
MFLTLNKPRDTAFHFELLSGMFVKCFWLGTNRAAQHFISNCLVVCSSQLLLEQTARYSISFELLSGPSMIDTPKPLRWWQGSELIRPRDTPTNGTDQNLKRRWSGNSDEWADRSLEAQLKCRRRHSPVPGWKREGSQWVFRPICWRLAKSKSGR